MGVGLLDKLFKFRVNKQQVIENKPTIDGQERTLTNAQIEFLSRLSKQAVDYNMSNTWTPIIGSIEQTISNFKKDGLIQDGLLADKFDIKYRLVDLKPLQSKYDVKSKGKKADIIKSLLEIIPQQEASALVSDILIYSLTPKGQNIIDTYFEQKKQAQKRMETEAISSLIKGDVNNAMKTIAQNESQQVFSGDTSFDNPPLEVIYLLNGKYDDLVLDNKQRQEIGARLALSFLHGESASSAGKRLLEVTNGQFPCPQLIKFLQNPCGGYASHINPNNNKELAEIYAHTRFFEATSHRELKQLMSDRSLGKGIEILNAPNDHCPLCNVSKLHYSWSEIDKLPKLPRHWGCRCDYVLWMST